MFLILVSEIFHEPIVNTHTHSPKVDLLVICNFALIYLSKLAFTELDIYFWRPKPWKTVVKCYIQNSLYNAIEKIPTWKTIITN